ncbi:MAG: hypothetical protein ACW99A_06120 [Candidatus Kariarchaeaceae archaeon]|jgi:hypothetical protein
MLFIGDKNSGKSLSMDELYQSAFNPFKVYYDFYEDAWIGYIPSSFLVTQPSAENIEPIHVQLDQGNGTSKTMISYVIDTFIEKGVHHIETDFQLNNRILIDNLSKCGYSLISSERLASRLFLEQINLPEKYKSQVDLNVEIKSKNLHLEPTFLRSPQFSNLEKSIIQFLVDKENISKSSFVKFFKYLKDNPDKIISQSILMQNGEILGHVMVARTRWNKNTGILSFLNIKDKDNHLIRDILMAKSVIDCKSQGIELLEVYIRDDVLLIEKNYERYGFEFSNVHHFEI